MNAGAARLGPDLALLLVVSSGSAAACGGGMLAAAALGATAGDGELGALAAPGALALALGLTGLWALRLPRAAAVQPTAGLGSITLAWVLAAAIGSIPLIASGVLPSALDGYFEAMSGFSTTGATLIDDVDAVPEGILAWRSVMQWLGGVGIVVLIVAIAPAVAPGLQRYFYAEASGIGDNRLTPRIADTAKIVGGIYVALTVAAGIAYLIAGMGPFDAVNHALTTVATGGFSTHTSSFAAFDSLGIEIVAIVFMVVAAINFGFYWRAIKGGSLMPQFAEIRIYLSLLVIATTVVTISLLHTDKVADIGEGLREAAFTVVSLSSTTGFTTVDFDLWSGFAEVVLVLLMVIGGCAGSTAGGMKVIRVALLAKSAGQELQRQTQPRVVTVLRMGGKVFSENVRGAVLGFAVIYVLVFAAGVICFTASGLGEVSAIGGVAATLANIGPGLGDVGGLENFSALPDGGRVAAIFLMLAGRLEIFTVVALLAALASRLRRS